MELPIPHSTIHEILKNKFTRYCMETGYYMGLSIQITPATCFGYVDRKKCTFCSNFLPQIAIPDQCAFNAF